MTALDLAAIRARLQRAATCTLSDIDRASAIDLVMEISSVDAPALLAEIDRLTTAAIQLDRMIRAQMRFSRDAHGGVPFDQKARWQDGHKICRDTVHRVLNDARKDPSEIPS